MTRDDLAKELLKQTPADRKWLSEFLISTLKDENSASTIQSKQCTVKTLKDTYKGFVRELQISVRKIRVDGHEVLNIANRRWYPDAALMTLGGSEYTIKLRNGTQLKCGEKQLIGTLNIAVEGLAEPVILDLSQIEDFRVLSNEE